jgi:hypothetical protein
MVTGRKKSGLETSLKIKLQSQHYQKFQKSIKSMQMPDAVFDNMPAQIFLTLLLIFFVFVNYPVCVVCFG